MKGRAEALREIESRSFDVCVIGAGASGAGCALDAQLRGLRTVLVEAEDFGCATSSASTKLVHGGVRYLQQAFTGFDPAQLKVVREALQERVVMLRNAPYLARSCDFVIPCFSRFELLYYRIGLKLYDWFAGDAKLGESHVLTTSQAVAEFPTLKSDCLRAAVIYQDGQFDDARYAVTLVKSFADAGGAIVNHLKVTGFEKDAGSRLRAAVVEDALGGRSFHVQARAFVNATGPFSDQLRALANAGVASRLVHSKGVHLLLPLIGDLRGALLIPRTEDGRVIFAIPWQGRLLVGTTEQEVNFPEDLGVSREEAEFLIRHLNRFSTVQYSVDDVVSAFSGVRPLVRKAQAKQAKNLIRDHEVELDPISGLISILGGKWTTYRAMAEDTIDVVQKQLGVNVSSRTRSHLLAGSVGYHPDDWRLLSSEHGLSEGTAKHLLEKFGAEARIIATIAGENPELKSLIVPEFPAIGAEIVYCVRLEMAMTLEDVLARRIGLQFFSWELTMQAAPVAGRLLGRELGWSEIVKERAVEQYVTKLKRMSEALNRPV
jgi:glycerol-3-phosphate dehydrogenase